ncbi:MAG TPA: zinc ribbon domain-containing protein [candidate division Zixibacteria bacterium]|nr:zinc ribbon domain-containing protein [candidate division Zixibacteria bacterium]
MDAIRDAIEWIAGDSPQFVAGLLPYLLLGIGALYVLWVIIGYLRVSQVGIQTESTPQPVLPLPRAAEGVIEPPRGVPYCPVDGLQYPPDARFCTQCEAELSLSCANCGATIQAADESCYRCGTRATTAVPALH